jgi:hypothetical protein
MQKGGFCQGLRLLQCSSLTDAHLDARWGLDIKASAIWASAVSQGLSHKTLLRDIGEFGSTNDSSFGNQ